MLAAGILIAAAASFFALRHRAQPGALPEAATDRPQIGTHPTPTLYCDFYNFMHNATVVSFFFTADLSSSPTPRVSELFVVEPDGTKTEFGQSNSAPSPSWTLVEEDGAPTITSPDHATTIILYGLKQHTGGVFWVEAGIRSNEYRNLEGKCRQANFGGPQSKKVK